MPCNRTDMPPFCTASEPCSVRLLATIAPSELVAMSVAKVHD
jgi:hypothetical protein